jgi:replicative superfamily II helicase
VARAAADGNWNDKLAPILALKKSTRPGDIERAMNRALNFVQAHQMRLFVSRVIHRLTNLNEQEFEDYLYPSEVDKKTGKLYPGRLTTRALADLASAMEKCQAASYQALGDTGTERVKRGEVEADPEVSAGDMHARIASAMAAVAQANTPQQKLLDAQLTEANRLKDALKKA